MASENGVFVFPDVAKQAMLYAYRVEDSGEPPAHTMGYLVEMMLRPFMASAVSLLEK